MVDLRALRYFVAAFEEDRHQVVLNASESLRPVLPLVKMMAALVAEVVRLRSGSTCGGVFSGALRCPTRARHNLDH